MILQMSYFIQIYVIVTFNVQARESPLKSIIKYSKKLTE